MAKQLSCNCGGTEFITKLNQYDIDESELINGILEFQSSENTDDEFKVFCRECG
jgi:hypothetical protein